MQIINTIGLAYRARRVTAGTDITISKLRSKELKLILLATDASSNTKKLVYDKAKFYHTDVLEELTSSQLSKAIGKNNIKVLGITDAGFSKTILSQKRK